MPAPLTGMVTRRVTPLLDSLSAEEPVIALHGPRAVGKSTILHTFAEARGIPVVDLDDPAVREAVLATAKHAITVNTAMVAVRRNVSPYRQERPTAG